MAWLLFNDIIGWDIWSIHSSLPKKLFAMCCLLKAGIWLELCIPLALWSYLPVHSHLKHWNIYLQRPADWIISHVGTQVSICAQLQLCSLEENHYNSFMDLIIFIFIGLIQKPLLSLSSHISFKFYSFFCFFLKKTLFSHLLETLESICQL